MTDISTHMSKASLLVEIPQLIQNIFQTCRPQKAGRALFNGGSPPAQTPNVIQYYTNPEKFGEIPLNSITSSGIPVPHLDGSTNQWHTHSVVTSPDEENCGLSKVTIEPYDLLNIYL